MVEALIAVTAFLLGTYAERMLIWKQVNNAREEARREQARADKAMDIVFAQKSGAPPVSDFTEKEIVEPRRKAQEEHAKQVAEYYATEIGGGPYETDTPPPED